MTRSGDRGMVSQHKLTRNMSIATCLPLSWKLLMYARDTLLVASESTPKPSLSKKKCSRRLIKHLPVFVCHFSCSWCSRPRYPHRCEITRHRSRPRALYDTTTRSRSVSTLSAPVTDIVPGQCEREYLGRNLSDPSYAAVSLLLESVANFKHTSQGSSF